MSLGVSFCPALPHVPNRIVVVRPLDKPWMNSEIRRAVSKRNRLLKIFCQNKVPENWEVYRLIRFIRRRKKSFYNNLNNKLQDRCWDQNNGGPIIKQFYGNTIQTTVPILLEGDGLVTDPKVKQLYQ